ncbi:MAG: hypothetical protein J3K34DRAFT_455630 [Monoraphidium minutum]|nr:MAG: hypothetical protein J3K34DRAFT_455630 [Monoraphidium minutum]
MWIGLSDRRIPAGPQVEELPAVKPNPLSKRQIDLFSISMLQAASRCLQAWPAVGRAAAAAARAAPRRLQSTQAAPGVSDGPVYIVFGATGGIGSALSRRLARHAGATLVLSSHDEARLKETAARLQAGGGGGGEGRQEGGAGAAAAVSFATADAMNPEAVDHVVLNALAEHGRVDAVACCIGNVEARSLLATPLKELDRILKLNLHTQFNVLQASVKAMLSNEGHRRAVQAGGHQEIVRPDPAGGAVVMVSAALAGHGVPNYAAFAAAKAGVEGLMRAAAATYAPHRVRVNYIAPGLVATPQTEKFTENEQIRGASEEMHPSKRLTNADEAAAAVKFLMAGPGAVTGQVLAVDGGLSTLHPGRVQDFCA